VIAPVVGSTLMTFASAEEPRLQRGESESYRPLRHQDARGVVVWPTATTTTDGVMSIDAPPALHVEGSTITQPADAETIADNARDVVTN
jgi:hypothetical protein